MINLKTQSGGNAFKGRMFLRYALLMPNEEAHLFGKRKARAGLFQERIERHRRLRSLAKQALVAGMLLLIATSARAQNADRPRGSIGIGPQVGIFKAQDGDDPKLMWGAAMRIKLAEGLGVEGSINYRQEEYNNGAVKVNSWPVMVTGLLYPIPEIYGAIGAGWYNSSIDYNYAGYIFSSETKQEFGWHFGGGVELPVGAAAKLVGDVRYVFLDYDFQTLPGSADTKSNFYVIDIGLLFGL